jgi:hypothetical protein
MNDNELLNLAAKAAGLDVEWRQGWDGTETPWPWVAGRVWNPLLNDGDAFRLAVKLELKTSHIVNVGKASYACVEYELEDNKFSIEPNGSDPYGALRRAIVVAAAERGKAMP